MPVCLAADCMHAIMFVGLVSRSRYLRKGWIVVSHSKLWNAITYPCPRYQLLAPKSSFVPNNPTKTTRWTFSYCVFKLLIRKWVKLLVENWVRHHSRLYIIGRFKKWQNAVNKSRLYQIQPTHRLPTLAPFYYGYFHVYQSFILFSKHVIVGESFCVSSHRHII